MWHGPVPGVRVQDDRADHHGKKVPTRPEAGEEATWRAPAAEYAPPEKGSPWVINNCISSWNGLPDPVPAQTVCPYAVDDALRRSLPRGQQNLPMSFRRNRGPGSYQLYVNRLGLWSPSCLPEAPRSVDGAEMGAG